MATMHGMENFAKLGLVSRRELVKKLEPNLVDYRVQDGSLIAVHRGVYRFRGSPESWESRALALTMYGGPRSAISHYGAAYLHGLEGFKEPTSLDLLVPIDVQIKPHGATVHRTREHLQIYKIDKMIPTTTMARTLIDLCEHLTDLQLEIALNSAWRMTRTIAPWLCKCIDKLHRTDWRGLDRLITMLKRMNDGGLDSGLEVKAERDIARADLPPPVRRLIIRDEHQRYVIRADLGWVEQRVVVHVDGYAFHQSERAMVRDARQRSQLSLMGWTQIIVMSKTMGDGVWLQQLRRALGR